MYLTIDRTSKEILKFPINIEVAVNNIKNGKIIINCPGAEGSVSGYKNKYGKIAEHVSANLLATFVRMSNPHTYGLGWEISLRHVLEYVLLNSYEFCGSNDPEIYLIGTSVGGYAVSNIAWEYVEVKKILLIEPADFRDSSSMLTTCTEFSGTVCIVVGDGDRALGLDVGQAYMDRFPLAEYKQLVVVPDCDHHFSGKKNGRILSQLAFYAFGSTFPDRFPLEEYEIDLYD